MAALEAMLDRPGHCVEVARYLEPRYADGESWAKLVRALEIQLSVLEEADPRAETILRIADLRVVHLDDGAGAYDLLADALRARPSDSRFADPLEQQAAALERWPDLVDLLRELAEQPGEAVALLLRTARIQQEEMEDSKGALQTFQEVLGLQPENTEAVAKQPEPAVTTGDLMTAEEAFEALRRVAVEEDWEALYDLVPPSKREAAERRWEAALADEDAQRMFERIADALGVRTEWPSTRRGMTRSGWCCSTTPCPT